MDVETSFNGAILAADWLVKGGSLASDAGLGSAIVISLFTDRRANADDVLPDGGSDRRGWWGDAVAPVNAPEGRPWLTGSRLWLLSREKQTAETAHRAEAYCREAMEWVTRLGVADRVDVAAEWVATGLLALSIGVIRAGQPPQRFDYAWKAAA